ncbi:hypothetical protein [Luteibacter yeojuensis]|uniref:DUF1444 family protein n=1 Tax=Luteibacter yeojuensis TaxID=345309 RepID=A0A0F3KJH8_9GAMM|nr:hypothetical protein [Luteibacter yeojuensis]KJV31316.1 hypothetical protein VI08_13815 [Luteibacter yeojuensis]
MGLLDLFKRKLTHDDFAAMVIRRAREKGNPRKADYDAPGFCIAFELADGRPFTMNLHNAYRDTLAVAPGKRNAVIDTYLASLLEAPREESPEETIASLMPTIRDTAMFAWGALQGRLAGFPAGDNDTCLREFVGDLSVALVVDSEHATRSANRATLEKCGLGLDAAFAQALANLRERTDDAGMQRHGNVWTSSWHDVFDASRLLLTDMIHRLPVRGAPVAAIPTRNHLFVTGSLDDEGIAAMASVAADVLENDTRPLSEQLLVLRDGTWYPYEGALPSATAARLTMARYKRLDGIHADQKALLEKIHEKEGEDVFVASFRAVQDTTTGEISSSGQWTRGVATLLPHADYLRLWCKERHEMMDVPWAAAAELIPALTTPEPALSPRRYRVSVFPDDATYAALKARAAVVREIQPG